MTSWEAVQNRFADIPGQDGELLRAAEYRPYFLRLGMDVVINPGCRFYHPDRIVLDDGVRINEDVLIYGSGGVRIGRNVRVGPRVFIHSANHDVSAGPTAFFERGYSYESVRVGDNCLISGNVSILPGASLGNGCFAAAGAVITRGDYADESRLRGVPAQAVVPRIPPVRDFGPADILVVVPLRPDRFAAGARALASVLGLPQLRVVPETMLRECRNPILLFGPADWIDRMRQSGWLAARRVWRLSWPDAIASGEGSVRLSSGKVLRLPEARFRKWAPGSVHSGGAASRQDIASIVTAYAVKRLTKREPEDSDIIEWLLFLHVLQVQTRPAWLVEIVAQLAARSGSEAGVLARAAGNDAGDLDQALIRWLKRYVTVPEKWSKKSLSAEPLLALRVALDTGDADIAAFLAHLSDVVEGTKRADHLAAFALAALMMKQAKLYERACLRLVNEFTDPANGCVRAALGSESYCYTPLLAAWLTSRAREEVPEYLPLPYQVQRETLQWRLLDSTVCQSAQIGSRQGSFVDARAAAVSGSLLDNWFTLATIDRLEDGTQAELVAENYRTGLLDLESLWMDVFSVVAREEALQLVQIQPWPFPYRYALSLRYDVDRPLNSTQVQTIVGIQKTHLNAACASWYFFSGDPATAELRRSLACHVQEVGIHVTRAEDERVRGLGTTFHSALNSEYWRAATSVAAVADRGAAYTEQLYIQSGRPRLCLVAPEDAAMLEAWVTPLHFPLEASSGNAGLGYFDRRLEQFHELRERGGHVILASHPDVDQAHLVALLAREGVEDAWCATPREVVDRCRQTTGYDATRVMSVSETTLTLRARTTLADLRVIVHRTTGGKLTLGPIQLNAGQERAIAFDPGRSGAPVTDASC
jgi:acetyltransferase-like isoleucine patch superfamily enzyme